MVENAMSILPFVTVITGIIQSVPLSIRVSRALRSQMWVNAPCTGGRICREWVSMNIMPFSFGIKRIRNNLQNID